LFATNKHRLRRCRSERWLARHGADVTTAAAAAVRWQSSSLACLLSPDRCPQHCVARADWIWLSIWLRHRSRIFLRCLLPFRTVAFSSLYCGNSECLSVDCYSDRTTSFSLKSAMETRTVYVWYGRGNLAILDWIISNCFTPVKTTVWSRLVAELADDIATSNVTINYSEFCEASIGLRLRNIESRLLRWSEVIRVPAGLILIRVRTIPSFSLCHCSQAWRVNIHKSDGKSTLGRCWSCFGRQPTWTGPLWYHLERHKSRLPACTWHHQWL